MTTRKMEDRNIRKIARVGKSSLGITLPIEMLRGLGWGKFHKVIVTKSRRTIIIKDWKH